MTTKSKSRKPNTDKGKKKKANNPIVRAPNTNKKDTHANQYKQDWTDKEIRLLADDMYKFYKETATAYHLVHYFNSKDLQTSRSYVINTLVKKNEHLKFRYHQVKDICIQRLMDNGFTSNKSVALSIFLLKNESPQEFKDKQEYEHSGTLKNITTITEVVHTTQSNKDRLND